jgi:hypothetical protein
MILGKMTQIPISKKSGSSDGYTHQEMKGIHRSNYLSFDPKAIKRGEDYSSRGGRRSESFWKSGGSTASFFLSTL